MGYVSLPEGTGDFLILLVSYSKFLESLLQLPTMTFGICREIDTTQNAVDFLVVAHHSFEGPFNVFARYDAELIFVENGENSGELFLAISEIGDYPISCLEFNIKSHNPAIITKKRKEVNFTYINISNLCYLS